MDFRASDPVIKTLADNLVVAMGLWENAPATRLNLRLGVFRDFGRIWARRDGMSVITLDAQAPSAGKAHLYTSDNNGTTPPRIVEADIQFKRQPSANFANVKDEILYTQTTLAHELGHAIGFNHSWLASSPVARLTNHVSSASIMSYAYYFDTSVSKEVLNADEVALVARLYPDQYPCGSPKCTKRFSRTTSRVIGWVRNSDDTQDIYGANVLLFKQFDANQFRPVTTIFNRISGYASSMPNGSLNGYFDLDGVTPGNYTLLVAAKDDKDVRITPVGGTEPRIPYDPVDREDPKFVTGFERAWVRNISLRAGETLDVGSVLAGEDRSVNAPSRVWVTTTMPKRDVSHYAFYFWSIPRWELAHSSGVTGQNSYTTRLSSQPHYMKIFGWDGGKWIVLRDWSLYDYTARPFRVEWTQPVKAIGESRFIGASSAWLRHAPAIFERRGGLLRKICPWEQLHDLCGPWTL